MLINRSWLLFATSRQRNNGFFNFHLRLPSLKPWLDISMFRNRNIDTPAITFVKPSRFTLRCIVHPSGGNDGRYGNTQRLVCEQCGADYPYGPSPMPCANCACWRESGVVVKVFGRRLIDWVRSEHGYAVRYREDEDSVPAYFWNHGNVMRIFHWRRRAESAAKRCPNGEVMMFPIMGREQKYPWSEYQS